MSETLADLAVDLTNSIEWGGVAKAFVETFISVSMPGYAAYKLFDLINSSFNAAFGWRQPRYDPLTLDLDGDGLETVGINTAAPILFDHDGDGIKTGTGWVMPTAEAQQALASIQGAEAVWDLGEVA